MVGYTQPVQKRNLPADHPSRYKNLSVHDEQTGLITGYIENPDYVPLFICTRYPERVYDDVFCEHKGDKGLGACEDCPYLKVTSGGVEWEAKIYPYCIHEQIIEDENSMCSLYKRRVCFEECLECGVFKPRPPRYKVVTTKPKEKPVEPLTDLDILDIIGETGLEIS